MVGLRRSFWPMMGGYGRGHVPPGGSPEYLTNYPANSSKETLRSMASPVPPRLDRDPLARHRQATPRAGSRCCRWRTEQHGRHLPGNRRPDRRGLSGAGARVVACARSSPFCRCSRSAFPPNISISRHADAADRRRAEGVDGNRRERRASNPQAGDRDEPWRQQRGDVAGGAGSARASRAARGHHELVASARRMDCFPEEASRHPWRRDRDFDHAGALSAHRAERSDRGFSSRQHRDGEEISLALGAPAGPLRVAGAGLHESGAVGDATKARGERAKLLDHGARVTSALLDDVDKFDPELFLRKV